MKDNLRFREIKSSFKYLYVTLDNGASVAVVIDKCEDAKVSVVDDIENISFFLGCENIVLYSHYKYWRFWSQELGFRSLFVLVDGSEEIMAPPTAEIAVQIAENRYIRRKFSDALEEYCSMH